jgi:hypothetical protein
MLHAKETSIAAPAQQTISDGYTVGGIRNCLHHSQMEPSPSRVSTLSKPGACQRGGMKSFANLTGKAQFRGRWSGIEDIPGACAPSRKTRLNRRTQTKTSRVAGEWNEERAPSNHRCARQWWGWEATEAVRPAGRRGSATAFAPRPWPFGGRPNPCRPGLRCGPAR